MTTTHEPEAADARNQRRVVEGLVTSDKMAKTITVVVTRTYRHAKYGKYVRKRKKYHAHDEQELASAGDMVQIESCRPLSRLKRWRLLRIVSKAEAAGQVRFVDEGAVQ
jgi:small subunit ribosomal protein S17